MTLGGNRASRDSLPGKSVVDGQTWPVKEREVAKRAAPRLYRNDAVVSEWRHGVETRLRRFFSVRGAVGSGHLLRHLRSATLLSSSAISGRSCKSPSCSLFKATIRAMTLSTNALGTHTQPSHLWFDRVYSARVFSLRKSHDPHSSNLHAGLLLPKVHPSILICSAAAFLGEEYIVGEAQ